MARILRKVISGAQTGVDIAALWAAKRVGIATGGFVPRGCRTLDGDKPERIGMFQLTELPVHSYPNRTFRNVELGDATMRIAKDFNSPGELCTGKAIVKYYKPYLDVPWHTDEIPRTDVRIDEAASWIIENKVEVLNVAGNSEQTAPGIEMQVRSWLALVFRAVQQRSNL